MLFGGTGQPYMASGGSRLDNDMGDDRGAAGEAGIPWDKVGGPRLPLTAYYADLKARRYLRAFVRGGGSETERSRRGEVIDHWLLRKRVSSVDIVDAIKRVKDG